MSEVTSNSAPGISQDQAKKWWLEDLDDFQRAALSVASQTAEDDVLIEAHSDFSGDPSGWRGLSEADQERHISRHFNSNLDTILSIGGSTASTDGGFRGIDRSDLQVMAADYHTNLLRADIRKSANTDDDPFPYPSTFTGRDHVKKDYEGYGRIHDSCWPEPLKKERDKFDATRMMVLMGLQCSSAEEAENIANSKHCPSAYKDTTSGFTSLYNLLEKEILPSIDTNVRPWDTTQHRSSRLVKNHKGEEYALKSAMRITPRHFEEFSMGRSRQVSAVDALAEEKRARGDMDLVTQENPRSIAFDSQATSAGKSWWSSWMPSFLSSAKPTTDSNPAISTAASETTLPSTSNAAISAFQNASTGTAATTNNTTTFPSGGTSSFGVQSGPAQAQSSGPQPTAATTNTRTGTTAPLRPPWLRESTSNTALSTSAPASNGGISSMKGTKGSRNRSVSFGAGEKSGEGTTGKGTFMSKLGRLVKNNKVDGHMVRPMTR